MSEREMVSAERARAVIELHEAAVTGTKDITVAVTTLAATAPDLARTAIALHAIIEGRTTAPSFEEDNAARRAGLYPIKLAGRWHLYDNDGRMRAWPVTENGVRDGR